MAPFASPTVAKALRHCRGWEEPVPPGTVGSSTIALQLACRTAASMRLSEDFSFTGVFFSPFTNYTLFPLSPGGGVKHIFAQFRSVTGQTNTPVELVVNYITTGPTIQSFSLANGQTLNRPLTVTGSATATLGMQDIEVGDPEFDEAFGVKGSDEAKVRDLFAYVRSSQPLVGSSPTQLSASNK